MYSQAFRPCGNSQLIPVTSTPSSAVQASTGSIPMVRLAVSAECFVAFGSSTVSATIPTSSTPANGIQLMAGIPEVFDVGPNLWYSFVTSTGVTSEARMTPGIGL